MIRITFALVLAFLAGRMASAAEGSSTSATQSDLFYQASDQEVIFTPSLEMGSESGQVLGNQKKIEDSGATYKMKFEKGLTDQISAALEVKIRNGLMDLDEGYKLKSEGLQDLQLDLRGSRSIKNSTASMHYGAFIRHSLKDEKVTRVSVKFNGAGVDKLPLSLDPHSAGTSLTPYIGYSDVVGPYVLGARILQTVYGTKRDKLMIMEGYDALPDPVKADPRLQPQFKSVEEGGGLSELKVFAERNFSRLTVNVAAKFRHTSPKKETSPIERTVQDELDMLGLDITPSYRINSKADLIGGVSYTTLLNQNVIYNERVVESGEIMSVNIGGRFRF